MDTGASRAQFTLPNRPVGETYTVGEPVLTDNAEINRKLKERLLSLCDRVPFQQPRVKGIATSVRAMACLAKSSLAMVSRCTSLGPLARRGVR